MIEVIHEVLYDGGLQPIVDDLDFAVIGSGWQQSNPLVPPLPTFTPSDVQFDLAEAVEVGRYDDPVIFMVPSEVFSDSLFIDEVELIGSGWWADQPIVESLPPFYDSITEAPLLDIVLPENGWAEPPPIIILEPFIYFELQAADFAELIGAAPPGGKITIVIVTDAGEGLALVGSIGLGGAIILDTGLGDATLQDRGISDALEP